MAQSNLYLLGLTGGIATGKSVVVDMLAERGAWTLDADQVTRQVQQPGHHVYDQIIAAFGPEVATAPGGPLDRARLGAIVFSDPARLQQLEQIVHPAVHAEIGAWTADIAAQVEHGAAPTPRPVAVIDAIKLLEGGWQKHCNAIWVVTCTPAQQVARLMEKRGMAEAEARQRIAAQPPQESRLPYADVVIDNSGSLEHTRQQVEAAWQRLMPSG